MNIKNLCMSFGVQEIFDNITLNNNENHLSSYQKDDSHRPHWE